MSSTGYIFLNIKIILCVVVHAPTANLWEVVGSRFMNSQPPWAPSRFNLARATETHPVFKILLGSRDAKDQEFKVRLSYTASLSHIGLYQETKAQNQMNGEEVELGM